MAKIALICIYDNWAMGMRTLSNALLDNGHDPVVIHFKLPYQKQLKDFIAHPVAYIQLQSHNSTSQAALFGYNMDVNMFTPNEVELLGDILEHVKPDIIGMTTRTVHQKYISPLYEQMKRVKSAITVAGGFGVSMRPEKYLNDFDYLVKGEGEHAIVKMADCVDAGKKDDIDKVPNLIFRRGGQVIENKFIKPFMEKDYFYHPRMNLPPHYVIENNLIGKTDVFLGYARETYPDYGGLNHYYTMVGRGCMWDCSFCCAGQFYKNYAVDDINIGRRLTRSIDDITNELKLAKENGFSKVFFMDSFLVADRKFLLDLFDQYGKKVGLPFFAQLFPDQVLRNPEILESAVNAGMTSTVVGVQSGSERISNQIFNRKTSNENIIKFAELNMRYKTITVDYHIITHNPFETDEDLKESLDFIGKLPKTNAQLVLSRLNAFDGSRIHDMILENNLTLDISFHNKAFFLYLIKYCSSDEVFNTAYKKIEKCDPKDLWDIYAEIRSKYKNSEESADAGWDYYYKAEYDMAVQKFTVAIELDSLNWRGLNGRGWAYRQLNEFDNAISDFKVVIDSAPSFERDIIQEANRGLGWAYYLKGNYKIAMECFEEALRHTDNNAKNVLHELYRGMGWIFFQQADNALSKNYFRMALDIIGKDEKDALCDALKGIAMIEEATVVNK